MQAVLSWKIDNSTYAYILQVNGSYVTGKLDSNDSEWLSLVSSVSAMTETEYHAAFDTMSAALAEMGITVGEYSDSYFDNEPVNDIILLDSSDGGSDGAVTYDVMEQEINKVKTDILNEVNSSLDIYLQNNIQSTVQEIINQNNADIEERLQDMQNSVDSALQELEDFQKEMEANLSGLTETLEQAAGLIDIFDEISPEGLKSAITATDVLTETLEEFSAATVEAITEISDEIHDAVEAANNAAAAIATISGNVQFMQTTVTTLSGVCGTLSGMCSSLSAVVSTYGERINTVESQVSGLINDVAEVSASVISLSAATSALSASTVVISGNLTTLRNEYDAWMLAHNQFIVDMQASADTIFGMITDYRLTLNRLGLPSNLFSTILDRVEECVNKVNSMETLVNQLNALVMTFDARILAVENGIDDVSASTVSLSGVVGSLSSSLTNLSGVVETVVESLAELESAAAISADTLNKKIDTVDAKFGSYATSANTHNAIADVNAKFANYATSANTHNAIADVNAKFASYATSADTHNAINNLSEEIADIAKIVFTASTPSSMADNTVYFIIP